MLFFRVTVDAFIPTILSPILNLHLGVSTWAVSGEIQLSSFSVFPWCSFVSFVVKGFVRLTACGVSL